MAELKEGLIGGAVNLYFIYKFLRILTTPWEKSEAFKLGIVDDNGKILNQIIENQQVHNKFGGVVPEIASRAHLQILQRIIPLCFKRAKLNLIDVDIFCATCGPGLIGGLLV